MTAMNINSRYFKVLTQFKTYIITEELMKYNWNICHTASALGIHRNSLARQMAELGIVRGDEKKRKEKGGVGIIDRRDGLGAKAAADVQDNQEGSISEDKGIEIGTSSDATGERGVIETQI